MLVKNSLCALVTTVVLPLAVRAAPEVYTVDSDHTFPSFETSHRGLSHWRGKFNKTTGKIWLDSVGKTGRVEIEVDTRTVNFGLPSMDKALQNEAWLSTEKYPTATYKGTISYKGDKPAEVNGDFTLRGITIPLKLEIRSFNCEMNPMFKREQCGADARAQFDRREFGMTKDLVPTDPYVRLMIDVEALKGDAPIIIPARPPQGAGPDGPPPGAPP